MPTIIEGVSHLDTNELNHLLQSPENTNIYVIDVREPEEYVEGHIPGIPLIPMNNIPQHVEDFDKTAEYVFICRSGGRSLRVAQYFQSLGIANVHNVDGGMLAWDHEVAYGEDHMIQTFSMDQLIRKSTS